MHIRKRNILFALLGVVLILFVVMALFLNHQRRANSIQQRQVSNSTALQHRDADKSTRTIRNGTKIKIHFGKQHTINGVLNNSKTAKALIARMPYKVHMNKYDTDFCGTTAHLPYNKSEVHHGWLNGDIDYATDAPYFTILYKGEKTSKQYGYQVNIGVITSPLSEVRNLTGDYDVTVELAK
ncbi:cyclophilin-like fold protein [Pediococcus siamensis]|uniref:cyclophilin-like fold protein n=1 Tax=Pediococcus siamensis TaxID=381829 RepID=UPI0039A1A548